MLATLLLLYQKYDWSKISNLNQFICIYTYLWYYEVLKFEVFQFSRKFPKWVIIDLENEFIGRLLNSMKLQLIPKTKSADPVMQNNKLFWNVFSTFEIHNFKVPNLHLWIFLFNICTTVQTKVSHIIHIITR